MQYICFRRKSFNESDWNHYTLLKNEYILLYEQFSLDFNPQILDSNRLITWFFGEKNIQKHEDNINLDFHIKLFIIDNIVDSMENNKKRINIILNW